MGNKQVWLVSGAGRGMGVDIARAALSAGHSVIATVRRPAKVGDAVGPHDHLLAVALDVTDPTSIRTAVRAGLDRFGQLDVVVNNAGNFNAGFFEELTPDAFRGQIETTFFGPVNVAREVLPTSGSSGPARHDLLDRRPGRRGVPTRVRHRRRPADTSRVRCAGTADGTSSSARSRNSPGTRRPAECRSPPRA